MDDDFYFPSVFWHNFWLFAVSQNIENDYEIGMYERVAAA